MANFYLNAVEARTNADWVNSGIGNILDRISDASKRGETSVGWKLLTYKAHVFLSERGFEVRDECVETDGQFGIVSMISW